MKILKSIFSPRKLIIWIFILMIIITIPEFTEPAMSQTDAIVSMLCVDKKDNNFEIALSSEELKQRTDKEFIAEVEGAFSDLIVTDYLRKKGLYLDDIHNSNKDFKYI